MKKLALFLLLLPVCVSAQSIDIRGFGGIMMNTKANYATAATLEQLSRLNGVGGVGASYRSGRFEYGIGISYRRYSTVNRTILRFADDFDPVTGVSTILPVETTVVYKDPAIAVAPVFNYHFGRKKFDWYAGLSPAYIRYVAPPPSDNFFFSFRDGANSWAVEAQVGASYPVLPKLRVFAELQGGATWIPLHMRPNTPMWTTSLNLGAQFRLWEKPVAASPAAE